MKLQPVETGRLGEVLIVAALAAGDVCFKAGPVEFFD
jgi:hypothetical protein